MASDAVDVVGDASLFPWVLMQLMRTMQLLCLNCRPHPRMVLLLLAEWQ
jgi:hypothetical protein